MGDQMTAEEFNRLLKKYLEGKTSASEEEQLDEWYKRQAEIDYPELPETEKRALERKVWKRIRLGMGVTRYRWMWGVGVAASLILVATFVWINEYAHETKHEKVTQSRQNRFEMRNTTGAEQEIILSDSTLVVLKPNSRLVYGEDFNQSEREVFLNGEAFFQVKRDEMKPFIVRSGNLVTEVLGTSFRIRESQESNITEVSVSTGRVSVYAKEKTEQSARNGVILTANQQLSFNHETQRLMTGIVEEPMPIDIDSEVVLPKLDFKSVPLQEVLDALTHYYGIDFVTVNPKLKHCGINADLAGLSMFTQLELICRSIEATYERRGTVVFIHGDGC